MTPPVLSVEKRLRLASASVEMLHRLASFIDEPHEIDLFDDLKSFATAVASFTRALGVHLDAIRRALPASCQSIDAPASGGVR